ncbi:MAG: hypothetical protein IPN29_04015 [Saprospiraceae bacterium]|nr:hypothetical protein [Saprospiraceae bacterium]
MDKPELRYEKNVFINCPFDPEFTPLLKRIIFTVVFLGYHPRLALENSDSGEPRLQKILSIIRSSKFSIHDLSRIQATKPKEFYRLNMPFELGMDFASRHCDKNLSDKRFLILSSKSYEYMRALSDINGLDIKNHNDDPEAIVENVRAWFIETIKLKNIESATIINYDYFACNKAIFEDRFLRYRKHFNEHEAEKYAESDVEKLNIAEFTNEVIDYIASK